jgi:hypothetical protein
MHFIIKQSILFLTICSLWVSPALAQTLDETLEFADYQFKLANYNLALKEYQRVLFFNDGKNLQHIYEQIGSIYFFNRDFGKANYYFELSYKTTESDSIKTEMIFKKASCYMLDKSFKQATFELMNLPESLNEKTTDRKNFYFAICYWGLEDFAQAESSFLKILNKENQAGKEAIAMLFDKKKNFYRPNPKTAKIMSIVLPGSGQIYSGDFKNGINSLLLTGGFVALGVYMTHYYSFLDAFLTAMPWFMRYYQGGYKNAEKIASAKRANRRNKSYQDILQIIKNN